jgi:hypothetical protein
MPTYIRAQYSHWASTDPKLDKVTNTLYFFDQTNLPVDWQTLANDILAAFNVGNGVYARGSDRQQVKVYSMEDEEPRQPKATATSSVANLSSVGVREVALCLSFRGPQNVARQRGRLYMGPFSAASMAFRPNDTDKNALVALANRLAGIGGANIDWSVFSPTTYAATGDYDEAFHSMKQAWVDDAWDTVRSRGLPPTTRIVVPLDE